jgi:hypothetical protein
MVRKTVQPAEAKSDIGSLEIGRGREYTTVIDAAVRDMSLRAADR